MSSQLSFPRQSLHTYVQHRKRHHHETAKIRAENTSSDKCNSLVGDLWADVAAHGGNLEPVALPLLTVELPAGLDNSLARALIRSHHLQGGEGVRSG